MNNKDGYSNEKIVKVIYSALHMEGVPFKMYMNELKQTVIEWKTNKVVVDDTTIWFNGRLQHSVYNAVNAIKAGK